MFMERVEKDPKAFENLLMLGKKLKPFFEGTSTQNIMDEIRGKIYMTSNSKMKLIAQGAEAKIYLEDGKIIKERTKKNYRNEELDEFLRKSRTKKEVKLLSDLRRLGINVPRVIDSNKYTIILEFIDGEKLKDVLDRDNFEKYCKEIGKIVAKMHQGNIVHGDLTTSNIIIKNKELYFIDFGLSKETVNLEQKAADLLTLYQNFKSIHPEFDCWKFFLQGYKNEETEKILKTFNKMLKRRRYI